MGTAVKNGQLEQVQQDTRRALDLSARYDDGELETLLRRVDDTVDTLLKE